MKEDLKSYLSGVGHVVVDIGARELTPGDDYPDFVIPLAKSVAAGVVDRGVAVCGSGGACVFSRCDGAGNPLVLQTPPYVLLANP